MFPFLYFLTQNKFPVNAPIERDVNLPWSNVTFPIAGDFNLPWSTVEFMPVDNRMPLSGEVKQNMDTDWGDGGEASLGAELIKQAGPVSEQLSTVMNAMEEMWKGMPEAQQKALSPDQNDTMAAFQKLLTIHKRVKADHDSRQLAEARTKVEALIKKDPDAAVQLLTSFLGQLEAGHGGAVEGGAQLSLPAPKG